MSVQRSRENITSQSETAAGSSTLRVILGTIDLGRRALTEDKPCHEILESYLSRGYNEINSAILYADGETDKILGRYAPCRDPLKVSLAANANPIYSKARLGYAGVIEQLETSLKSLQVPSVDLFYLHWPDHETPIEETLLAVQELYKKGKFKEFGLSNYKSWEVAEVYYICKQQGYVLPTVYQGMYNAVTRMVEGELFPCLRHLNMRFYAYNTLAGGILTNSYKISESTEKQRDGRFWGGVTGSLEQNYRERYWRESLFAGIEGIKASLDKAYGNGKVSVSNASVRWMIHHSMLDPKYGDGIVIGGSTLQHINTTLDSTNDGPLDPSVVEAFDQAWQWDKANCASYYR